MKKRDHKRVQKPAPVEQQEPQLNVDPETLPAWQRSGYHMEPIEQSEQASTLSQDEAKGYPLEEQPAGVPQDLDIDPMSKTGEDSSIAIGREAGVVNHTGSFWEHVTTISQKIMKVPAPGQDEFTPPGGITAQTDTMESRPGSHVVPLLVLLLIVFCVVGWFAINPSFHVRSITVFGNSHVSTEWILQASGLKVNDHLLMINKDKVAEAINSNRYLKLRTIVHNTPDVQIQVIERVPVAYTLVRGIYYSMDAYGMVLEEYADASQLSGLIKVDKLPVKSCVVGQHLQLEQQRIMDAYKLLMLELKVMSLQWLVKELYLDRMDSISLETTDGYYVRMGDDSYLHGKLRAMTTTRVELIRRGLTGGTIDVTTRDKPTYMPALEEREFSWSATQYE